jgi:hypothetical protein
MAPNFRQEKNLHQTFRSDVDERKPQTFLRNVNIVPRPPVLQFLGF